jgi:TrkA domain protein
MAEHDEITTTELPGVGERREFKTDAGECVGVIVHRGGDHELLVYDRKDPDACKLSLRLSGDDARRLGRLLSDD